MQPQSTSIDMKEKDTDNLIGLLTIKYQCSQYVKVADVIKWLLQVKTNDENQAFTVKHIAEQFTKLL